MTSYNVFNFQAWVPCGEILFTRLSNVLCITFAEELVFSPQPTKKVKIVLFLFNVATEKLYFLAVHLFSLRFTLLFISFVIYNNNLRLHEDKGLLVCLPLCLSD